MSPVIQQLRNSFEISVCLIFCLSVDLRSEDWRLERIFLPERGVFQDEMLLSMDIDIDGDGSFERIIALETDSWGRDGVPWSFYGAVNGSSQQFLFLGGAIFRPDAFGNLSQKIDDTESGFYSYSPGGGGKGLLIRYRIVGGKVEEEVVREMDIESNEQDMLIYQGIRAGKPKIRRKLADEIYLQYPDVTELLEQKILIKKEDLGRRKLGKTEKPNVRSSEVPDSKIVAPSLKQFSWIKYVCIFLGALLVVISSLKFTLHKMR